MKNVFTVFVVLFSLLVFTGIVLAEDVILNAPIEQSVVKKDKNGNNYVRVLIQDKRELNGVAYDRTVNVMAFGNQVAAASQLKKGDTLNVVAEKSEFRGGTSYRILKFIE